MPEIGDIKRGYEIEGLNNDNFYIYAQCTKCGAKRWAQFVHGKSKNDTCSKCNRQRFGQVLKANYREGNNGN